jgi:hypothetical protein
MTVPSLRHERYPSLRMDKVELRRCLKSLQLPKRLGYHRRHGTTKTLSD